MSRFRLTDTLRFRNLASEGILLDLATDRCYGLNEVATRIFRALSAGHSHADLVELLVERYEIEPEDCRRQLDEFLALLRDLGLGGEARA